MVVFYRHKRAFLFTWLITALLMLGTITGCQGGLKIGEHWLIKPVNLTDATSFELMQFKTSSRPTKKQLREMTTATRLRVDLATGITRITDGQTGGASGDRGGGVYDTKLAQPQLGALQKIVTSYETLKAVKGIKYQYRAGRSDWYNLTVYNQQVPLTNVSWPAYPKAQLPDAAAKLIFTFNRVNRMAHRNDQNVNLIP